MIRFVVWGKAAPAGSKRAFVRGGRALVVDANKNAKPWQNLVACAALDAYQGPLLDEPLSVTIVEHRVRPKGHYRANGELSAAGLRKPFPTSAPDTGKIARGIHDALTGVLYRDDSLIVSDVTEKRWAAPGDRECTVVIVNRVVSGRAIERGAA